MIPTLSLLLACASPNAFMTFPAGPRSVACLGDVDGDGCPDFALGNAQRDPECVFLVSGKLGRLLATSEAPEGAGNFGFSVAPWFDCDSDGVRDFAVSAPGSNYCWERGEHVTGSVFVCSGRSGAIIKQWAGRTPGDAFGVEIARLLDVDGDGKDDLLVGAPGIGRVYILSGTDGRELREVGPGDSRIEFGEAVAGLGDVDGDQVPDFAVGACMENIGGRVHLYSGKDGRELRVIGPAANLERMWFGNGIAAAGDLDLDGKADLLVGSDMDDQEFCARVYSGATGAVLRSIRQPGMHCFNHFGAAVETLGDANADGAPDYLVADTDDIPEIVPAGEGNQARGSIVLVSGKTGETLFTVFGKKHFDRLGDSLAACADLDGDRVPDFVAKAANFPGGPSCWRAFSGKDGKELWQLDTPLSKAFGTGRESKR